MWKDAGANFPSQFPSYPVSDYVYLHFSGALGVDYFGSLMEVHTFIYIYTLWSNLCIWIINILLSDARGVN